MKIPQNLQLILIPLLLLSTAIISYLSFIPSPYFVQDDWAHLADIFTKNAGQVAEYFIIWQKTNLDPFNFYRPLPTKLYYFLLYHFFGLNSNWFLLSSIILFSINNLLFYYLFARLLPGKAKYTAIILALFNLANFTAFSYFTIAEVLLFSIFSQLALIFWIRHQHFFSVIAFIGALLCRETAVIIPLWLLLFGSVFDKNEFKRYCFQLVPFVVIDCGYLLLRIFVYGLPSHQDAYRMSVGLHIVRNLFQYLFWNLNLTGKILANKPLLAAIALCFAPVLYFIIVSGKNIWHKTNQIFLFGIGTWVLFLLPVLFFPLHNDPWNLIIPTFGLALFVAVILENIPQKLGFVILGLYLLLFFFGITYYSQHHWTIKRQQLVLETKSLIEAQCDQQNVELTANSQVDWQELQYAWYYNTGPQVLCHSTTLSTSIREFKHK